MFVIVECSPWRHHRLYSLRYKKPSNEMSMEKYSFIDFVSFHFIMIVENFEGGGEVSMSVSMII